MFSISRKKFVVRVASYSRIDVESVTQIGTPIPDDAEIMAE